MSFCEPFKIDIPDATLNSVRERVAAYPWHEMPIDGGWNYGSNLDYMKELAQYWVNEYDWRKHESAINTFPQFRAQVDGIDIHFIWERSNCCKYLKNQIRKVRTWMKKNIILIFTDNQQASTLGCYGNKEIYTPNLDQLSAESVTFDNAYCPNAFCSPCRASLLTGLLPSQHGVHSWIDTRKKEDWPLGWHALDGLRTLPMSLSESGYKTALIGKYHLGETETTMPGFDHWVTMEDGHVRSLNQIFMKMEKTIYMKDIQLIFLLTKQSALLMSKLKVIKHFFFTFHILLHMDIGQQLKKQILAGILKDMKIVLWIQSRGKV